MKTIRIFAGTAFLGIGLLLGGCATMGQSTEDADSVFKEAEESLKDEQFLVALEKFREVKNRFPYSSRALDAELRLADTYFAQESYLEAESSYEIFKELHPTHPQIDYVQFRIGLSYFRQIPENPARDLSAAYRAIDALTLFLEKYGSSQYRDEAKGLIKEARYRLAEYQNLVADFYFRRRHYLSATQRYTALLSEYPQMGFDEEALYRLGESYYHIRMFANAKDTLKQLVSKYPGSEHKAASVALLRELEETEKIKK